MGNRGFFGPYNIDMGSTEGDLASLNGWFQQNIVSGSTGVTSHTRLAIFPVLQVNPAVAIRGIFQIGPILPDNLGDAVTAETRHLVSEIRRLRFAGKWRRLWIEVNTPLGKVYYGNRPFLQGCGLQFSSPRTAAETEDTTERSEEVLQFEAFTGPLTFAAGFYPWRRGSPRYWNPEDQNAARVAHVLGFTRDASACMDMGVGGFYLTFNEGPESERTTEARASFSPVLLPLLKGGRISSSAMLVSSSI